MRNRINVLLIALPGLLLYASCHKKEKPPFFTLSSTSLMEQPGASRDSVKVSTNVNWATGTVPSWIHINQTNGSPGDSWLVFSFSQNSSADPLTADVVVTPASSSGLPASVIHITQAGTAPFIHLDKSALADLPEGQTDSVTVSSNTNWNLSIPQDATWITTDILSGGAGNTKVHFTIAGNSTLQPRNASLTFAAGPSVQSQTVTLSQNYQKPNADFSAAAITTYAPARIRFTNASSFASSYSWNFGNGITSSRSDTTILFSNPGTYSVTLTASNANGDNSTKTTQITVLQDPSLLAWYPLNGNAQDMSGNNHAATGYTLHATVDRKNNPASAIFFDGSATYIELPKNLVEISDTAETISLWVKPFDVIVPGVLFSYQDAAYPNLPSQYVPAIYKANQNLYARFWPGASGINSYTLPPPSPNIGWMLITLTRSNNVQKLYFNGNLVLTMDGASDFGTMSYNYLGLGYSNGYFLWAGLLNGYSFYYGLMDDVRIYKKALSDNEVKALFDQ